MEVPIAVLVKMICCGSETTIVGALNSLLVLETGNASTIEAMEESGIIEGLWELLRCHQFKKPIVRLSESLLNKCEDKRLKS